MSDTTVGRAPLPRALVLLFGLGAACVIAGGMRAASSILAPTILALVLMITVHPIRVWLERKKVPSWLAALVTILTVYLILIVMIVSIVVCIGKMASLVPQYTPQVNDMATSFGDWLGSLGVSQSQVDAITGQLDFGRVFSLATTILTGILGVVSNLIFIGTLTIFIAFDAGRFPATLMAMGGDHARVIGSLGVFAHGTRTYFAVSAIFGFIVAVIDTVALQLMGVPGAVAWGILAFITNFIPNIGFVIGLVPPALIALLDGGVGLMIAVIVMYCVVNFIIQSVIQPKFQADALNLGVSLTFLSLVFWTFVLGPLGALLALPMTLFVRAILVDSDPTAGWVVPLLSGGQLPEDSEDAAPAETQD